MTSAFLAGGNLTALVRSKQGCAMDIFALSQWCLYALVRAKASDFFFNHTSLGWHILWEQKGFTWSECLYARVLDASELYMYSFESGHEECL